MWNDASTEISVQVYWDITMFCNSLLEILPQKTMTVHRQVSETGNLNTAWQKGSATKGFQRTLNWGFWLGMKRRMETEVGPHLNCHSVTNTTQMLQDLQLPTPTHKPHTGLYVPQALTARSIAYTNGITVCHTAAVHWSWRH